MSSADVGGERTSAADLAAGALLGALAWEPRRAHDLPWLNASDFWRPTDAAVYATITGLLADHGRADARTIEASLRAGGYHDVRGPVRDNPAVVLHTLLSTTPAAPPEPGTAVGHSERRSEHVRYAQLVLDDAIRREVSAAGAKIGQTTRQAITLDREAAADRIDEVLHDTVDRLEALTQRHRSSTPGGLRDGLTTTLPAHAFGETNDAQPRGREGTTRGPLRPREVYRAEQRLIGCCLTYPDIRAAALAHLRPTDFADAALAATWSAITDLSRDGGPVDYVFAAAELERRAGHQADGLAPARLRDLSARAIPVTGDLDTVARAALERIGHSTERDLTSLATDKVGRAAETLDAAQEAVQSARATARRIGNGSPNTSRAAPAARAAPPTQRSASSSTASLPPVPVRETISPNPPPRRRT